MIVKVPEEVFKQLEAFLMLEKELLKTEYAQTEALRLLLLLQNCEVENAPTH